VWLDAPLQKGNILCQHSWEIKQLFTVTFVDLLHNVYRNQLIQLKYFLSYILILEWVDDQVSKIIKILNDKSTDTSFYRYITGLMLVLTSREPTVKILFEYCLGM